MSLENANFLKNVGVLIVFQTSRWTAVSCFTKERQTVESMLSSQTNLSHSTFTVK